MLQREYLSEIENVINSLDEKNKFAGLVANITSVPRRYLGSLFFWECGNIIESVIAGLAANIKFVPCHYFALFCSPPHQQHQPPPPGECGNIIESVT